MIETSVLYDLLRTGAGLAAAAAAGELSKVPIKDAYDALKARLIGEHKTHSVALLDQVGTKPAYAAVIKEDLKHPEIATDPEIGRLAEILRAAVAATPPAEAAHYAIDIRQGIEAARNIRFAEIEGIRANSLKAGGDLTMEGIRAPQGKPSAA